MIFAPKNGVEKRVGEFVLFMLPYLNAMTYKFHVEKCREIGKSHSQRVVMPPLRVELQQINLNLILYRN